MKLGFGLEGEAQTETEVARELKIYLQVMTAEGHTKRKLYRLLILLVTEAQFE